MNPKTPSQSEEDSDFDLASRLPVESTGVVNEDINTNILKRIL